MGIWRSLFQFQFSNCLIELYVKLFGSHQNCAADWRDGDGPEAAGEGQHHRGDAGKVGRAVEVSYTS